MADFRMPPESEQELATRKAWAEGRLVSTTGDEMVEEVQRKAFAMMLDAIQDGDQNKANQIVELIERFHTNPRSFING